MIHFTPLQLACSRLSDSGDEAKKNGRAKGVWELFFFRFVPTIREPGTSYTLVCILPLVCRGTTGTTTFVKFMLLTNLVPRVSHLPAPWDPGNEVGCLPFQQYSRSLYKLLVHIKSKQTETAITFQLFSLPVQHNNLTLSV